jgi:hypothetical protein
MGVGVGSASVASAPRSPFRLRAVNLHQAQMDALQVKEKR